MAGRTHSTVEDGEDVSRHRSKARIGEGSRRCRGCGGERVRRTMSRGQRQRAGQPCVARKQGRGGVDGGSICRNLLRTTVPHRQGQPQAHGGSRGQRGEAAAICRHARGRGTADIAQQLIRQQAQRENHQRQRAHWTNDYKGRIPRCSLIRDNRHSRGRQRRRAGGMDNAKIQPVLCQPQLFLMALRQEEGLQPRRTSEGRTATHDNEWRI